MAGMGGETIARERDYAEETYGGTAYGKPFERPSCMNDLVYRMRKQNDNRNDSIHMRASGNHAEMTPRQIQTGGNHALERPHGGSHSRRKQIKSLRESQSPLKRVLVSSQRDWINLVARFSNGETDKK